MKSKKPKTPKPLSEKSKPVWVKEAERSGKAYQGYYRKKHEVKGFNLNKTGTIRALYNFVESSNWEPSYFKDRRNVPHINFVRTAEIWATALHDECKFDDWTADWSDDRTFKCERDYLDHNTPDFKVLGGKVSVHKSTHKKLDEEAREFVAGDPSKDYQAYYFEQYPEEYLETLEDIEISSIDEEIF